MNGFLFLAVTLLSVPADTRIPFPPSLSDIPADLPAPIKEAMAATFDPRPERQCLAAFRLGEARNFGQVVTPFILGLCENRDIHWRCQFSTMEAVVESIKRLGESGADPCIAAFREATGELRYDLVWVLAGLEDSRAIETVVPLLSDPNPENRERAWREVVSSGNPKLVDMALIALKDPVSEVREHACWFLRSIHSDRVVEPLLENLNDPNREVVSSAVYAIAVQRDSRAVLPLVAVLNDSKRDSWIRNLAAKSLGEIGDPRASPPLLDYLRDGNEQIEAVPAVLASLAKLKARRAEAPFRKILRDENRAVGIRGLAARALGDLMGRFALCELKDVLFDTKTPDILRAYAAIGIVDIEGGNVWDTTIVDAIAPYCYSEKFSLEDDARAAVKKVAGFASSLEIRTYASEILARHRFVSRKEILVTPIIFLAVLPAFTFALGVIAGKRIGRKKRCQSEQKLS